MMIKSILYLLICIELIASNDSSYCLCTLKKILEDYALITTDIPPPRYRSFDKNDIGFYINSSGWKKINDATWIELSEMINSPLGMYSQISVDGINPIENGLLFDNIRSSYLADLVTQYRFILDQSRFFYEKILQNRTNQCLNSFRGSEMKSKWKKYFLSS